MQSLERIEIRFVGDRRGEGGRVRVRISGDRGIPTRRERSASTSDPIRDAVEPVPKQFPATKRCGTTDKYDEGRLERIFDLVRVVEQLPTHAKNHRAVPSDNRPECLLVVAADECLKKLRLGSTRQRTPGEEMPELRGDGSRGTSP